jgi:hypothetical protein
MKLLAAILIPIALVVAALLWLPPATPPRPTATPEQKSLASERLLKEEPKESLKERAPAPEPAPIAHDFSTPEGAILCLEDAYRANSIEAAVAAKDFATEARIMLKKLARDFSGDPVAVEQTAATLELTYRTHLKENWPDFNGVASAFRDRKDHAPGIVSVVEIRRFPDGTFTEQKLHAAQTAKGWRVVTIVEE